MRGYPRCVNDDDDDGDLEADPEAPVPCVLSTLYGDTSTCQIGRIGSPDSDGWNRELWVDCDGTRGMSGSAMYSTGTSLGLAALGAYSQAECTAAGCATHALRRVPQRDDPHHAAIRRDDQRRQGDVQLLVRHLQLSAEIRSTTTRGGEEPGSSPFFSLARPPPRRGAPGTPARGWRRRREPP